MIGSDQLPPLGLQDGAGDQEVEVVARQTSPEDLRKTTRRWEDARPQTTLSPSAGLLGYRHTVVSAHLPQGEDVLEGKLSLEPDEQPAETEAQRAAVLRV